MCVDERKVLAGYPACGFAFAFAARSSLISDLRSRRPSG
jgi:hypothetical protein